MNDDSSPNTGDFNSLVYMEVHQRIEDFCSKFLSVNTASKLKDAKEELVAIGNRINVDCEDLSPISFYEIFVKILLSECFLFNPDVCKEALSVVIKILKVAKNFVTQDILQIYGKHFPLLLRSGDSLIRSLSTTLLGALVDSNESAMMLLPALFQAVSDPHEGFFGTLHIFAENLEEKELICTNKIIRTIEGQLIEESRRQLEKGYTKPLQESIEAVWSLVSLPISESSILSELGKLIQPALPGISYPGLMFVTKTLPIIGSFEGTTEIVSPKTLDTLLRSGIPPIMRECAQLIGRMLELYPGNREEFDLQRDLNVVSDLIQVCGASDIPNYIFCIKTILKTQTSDILARVNVAQLIESLSSILSGLNPSLDRDIAFILHLLLAQSSTEEMKFDLAKCMEQKGILSVCAEVIEGEDPNLIVPLQSLSIEIMSAIRLQSAENMVMYG